MPLKIGCQVINLGVLWTKKNLSPQVTVMKFGGTSVEDGPAFKRAAQIVRSYERAAPVVVVSAMSGVTDALMMSARLAGKGELAQAINYLEAHFERHLQVAAALGATAQARMRGLVENSRTEISELLNIAAAGGMTAPALQDSIVSHGERLSANLLSLVLEEEGLPAVYVDARRCILTNDEHGNAQPLLEETSRLTQAELRPLVEKQRIPVLGGFIAATRNGATTTLGRGSSDYTATLISATLRARETQIWTDVDGVLTADPRLVTMARTVPSLSYREAAELSRLGARVLHPKMMQPALEQKIPVRICNSRHPEKSGTIIGTQNGTSPETVKAIAHKNDLTEISVTAAPTFVANGFLSTIQGIFSRHHTQFDLIGRSEVSVSLACAEEAALPLIVQELERVGVVKVKRDRAIVSFIGESLRGAASGATKFLNKLKDIDPTLIWQSTSEVDLTSTVDGDFLGPVIRDLHYAVFET